MSPPLSLSTPNARTSFLSPMRRQNSSARASARTSAWCATVAAASPPPSISSCCTSWATPTLRFTTARWANGQRIDCCPSRRMPSRERAEVMSGQALPPALVAAIARHLRHQGALCEERRCDQLLRLGRLRKRLGRGLQALGLGGAAVQGWDRQLPEPDHGGNGGACLHDRYRDLPRAHGGD